MKRRMVLLLSMAMFSTGIMGCGYDSTATGDSTSSTDESEKTSGSDDSIVTIAYTTAWDTLNPYALTATSMYDYEVWGYLYDRLAYAEAAGTSMDPRGASSWESANDGKSIIFHLDENATWHDGEPVTADDWVYTFELLANSETTGMGCTATATISGTGDDGYLINGETLGVSKIDDYTFEIDMKEATDPDMWLISYNRGIFVLPEHLLSDKDPATLVEDSFWTAPVGSGPLVYESEVVGNNLTLDAFDDYQLGKPGFGKLVCSVMDTTATLTATISGDIDLTCLGNALSASDKQIAEDAGLQYEENTIPSSYTEVILNNESLDKNLRKALLYSLDKDVLISVAELDGLATETTTPVLPTSDYYDSDIIVDYDMDKAKEYLEKSDYNGETLTMECSAARATLCASMQQYWESAGINVEIITVDVATMFSDLSSGSCDLGISGHTATENPLWFASQLSNLTYGSSQYFRISDGTYQNYLDEFNAATTDETRQEIATEYQEYFAEDCPCLSLYHSGGLHIESSTVSGVDYESMSMCNDNVWEWIK